jgi:5'-methylthioadenosine phosphorylase
MRTIGIIGGTGVEDTSLFGSLEPCEVATPFGKVTCHKGNVGGNVVYFLARHGAHHSVPPHKIPYKANIFALKKLGVTEILSFTAVGSLNCGLVPGTFVATSQILDFTKGRDHTFFDGDPHPVCHVDFAYPYCPALRERLIRCLVSLGLRHAKAGCYVVTEGPRYETAAEVRMFGLMGGDVAGMTQMPEAVLAREAEICYANCSVVTNLGSGLSHEALSHEEVTEMMNENSRRIAQIMHAYITDSHPIAAGCHCHEAAAAVGGFHTADFESR